MAYVTQYQSIFSNELNHRVEVYLQLKDGDVVEPAEFKVVDLLMNDDSDEGTIIAREAVLTVRGDDETVITWETFLPNTYDAWKLIVKIGDTLQDIFIGFLTPEEGNSPFLDKPYDVVLRATNGLKLLKDAPLTKLDGSQFKGRFTGMQYIAAALSKTLLEDIPILVYGSIYESSMDDRSDDITADWLSQAKWDHRTFMKDATAFESCYQVLLILLGRHSRLSFWKGRFLIFYSPEHQFRPGGLFYTEYNSQGIAINAEEDVEGFAKVGSREQIYPYNEDQIIAAKFGIKSARTEFKYNIIAELPLNNKFERGTLISTTGNVKRYTIDDWIYGRFTSFNSRFPFNPVAAVPYRQSTYNNYGMEISREIVLPPNANTGLNIYLLSEGMPVRQNDKIKIELDYKHANGAVDYGTRQYLRVYLYPKNDNDPLWMSGTGVWGGGAPFSITHFYDNGEDSSQYQTFNLESRPFPVDGTLYILFTSTDIATDTDYYRNFNLEYISFVAGGYVPVKGDYWQHTQNENMIDVDTAEILISDSLIPVAKGAIWRNDGVNITTPTWNRFGVGEARHFKELVNIWRFNLAYRRFYRIEGSFTGLFYEPSDDQLNKQLISWHKEYAFMDMDPQRRFIMIPPLQMDIGTGNIRAEFHEVLNPNNVTTRLETVDEVIQRLALAINRNDAVEWDGNGEAPEAGTLYFPPTGAIYTFEDRCIGIAINEDDEATATVDANGAGNSPSITEIYSEVVTPGGRLQIFQLGADIAEGNIFTITIYGVDVNVTVREITLYSDGSQLADSQVYNYIF